MPYIGKQLVRGQNRKLDDISSGFDGSQTTFTLQVASQNVTVGSALQLWISLGGVIQDPLSDYTIAGNQITFTTAPAASLDFFGVIQGDVTDTNTPGDATVTTSKLATGLTVNLADGSAATSSLQLGGTDSGLFSSAADKVNVTTGGVERLEIGDSEVVFNDPSNDVDFRVESNGNTHMLYVDAGNDVVGIGTSSPVSDAVLTLSTDSDTALFFRRGASTNQDGAIRFESGAFQFLNGANSSTVAGLSERMRIDSSGRLLVGTSSSYGIADKVQIVSDTGVNLHRGSSNTGAARLDLSKSRNTSYGSNTIVQSGDTLGSIVFRGDDGTDYTTPGGEIKVEVDGTPGSNDMPGRLLFSTTADGASSVTERMRIDSSGNVGIGTSSPDSLLTVDASSNPTINIKTSGTKRASLIADTGNSYALLGSFDGYPLVFSASAGGGTAERARIDTSGRLLVGTSTNIDANPVVQIKGYAGDTTGAGWMALSSGNSTPSNNENMGLFSYFNAGGGEAARIECEADAAHSGSSAKGRLVFMTTASGDVSPTERMRVTGSGDVLISRTSASISNVGHYFLSVGAFNHTRNADVVGEINRLTNDGTLINFRQADSVEGSISVSGSTVSYNGGHLARWSQLASGAERTDILRGSVLSNLDEMCEWGEEDNEQLNRMKVSDVEGDVNVAGVFQAWDDDDDTYTDDFYCAVTGDFVIRVAQGTTVARGDLLMSAGDGTAKPQDDDIVRSKTIAKVTSTTVSTTYTDGSYCVPCVLMAC